MVSDSFISRLLPVALVAVLAFAGWWLFLRTPHTSVVQQQAPGVLDAPSTAGPYLLQASQVGPTYDQVAAETRSTTSAEIRKDETAAGLATIRSSWKAGAHAGWYQVHGAITITSRAEVFSSSQLSIVSSVIRRQMLALYHGRAATAPSALPGTDHWFITGRTISPLYSQYSPRRQVAVAGWQDGDVLGVIVVTGLPRDDVPTVAARLAVAQDQHIAFVAGH
jgi:hypothetical protein